MTDAASPGSQQLPQELIDKIVSVSDFETQVKLYTTNGLQTIVSPHTFSVLEFAILAYFKMKHRDLLSNCLSCIKYHVWDDGTPMKNRQVNKIKVQKLRTLQ